MVATLEILPPPPRRRFRRQRAGVAGEWIPVGRERYLRLTAWPDKRGRLPWEEIREWADRAAGRMLFAPGVTPPPETGLRPYRGQRLGRDLMAVTAVHLIRTASAVPGRMPVAVFDPVARMPQLASALLPFTADVQVVTARPGAYEEQEVLAMEAYGATFLITGEQSPLHNATLVLAPEGMHGLRSLTRGYVLSGVKEEGRHVVSGYMPQAQPEWLAAKPAWCDPWEFLSAMYEWGGLQELAAHPPEALWMNGHLVWLRDAACRLAGLDIGISV